MSLPGFSAELALPGSQSDFAILSVPRDAIGKEAQVIPQTCYEWGRWVIWTGSWAGLGFRVYCCSLPCPKCCIKYQLPGLSWKHTCYPVDC